jgi:aminotransferase
LEKANTIAGIVSARPTTFVYAGGIAALKGDMGYVEERRQEYGRRMELFCNALDKIDGISCIPSEGAFYAWFNIKELELPSETFCQNLLEAENVNTRAGSRFGLNVEGYVRAALVQPLHELRDAVRCISSFVENLSPVNPLSGGL